MTGSCFERFEKELLAQRARAQRSRAQQRLMALLAGACAAETVEAYLRGLADSGRSFARQITELLDLFRYYRPEAIAAALQKAHLAQAFGADYVAIHLPLDCLRHVGPEQWALQVPLGKLHTERLVPLDSEGRRLLNRILELRARTSRGRLAKPIGLPHTYY